MQVSPWHRARSAVFAAALLSCAFGMGSGRAWAWTVEISQEEIQAAVSTMFPIRQQIPFAITTFSDPRIFIVEGSDRVRMALAVRTNFSGQVAAAGRAEIEGAPGYDPVRGEFHLLRPAVTVLDFDQLEQEYLELVRMMANSIAEQFLPGIVIYRLDERDFRQGVMRRSLRGIHVRDGKLIAELDW